jgi:hypothetical protein
LNISVPPEAEAGEKRGKNEYRYHRIKKQICIGSSEIGFANGNGVGGIVKAAGT